MMLEHLRALAAISEDCGAVPSTHTVAHNPLELQFRGTRCSFLAPEGIRHTYDAHTTHIHTGRQSTLTHKMFKEKSLKPQDSRTGFIISASQHGPPHWYCPAPTPSTRLSHPTPFL